MKNERVLRKIKEISELFISIRSDNDLLNQDINKYKSQIQLLRGLVNDEEVKNFINNVEEILVIIDMNQGFTIMGPFKNPHMEVLIEPINEVAKEFDADEKKLVVAINDVHHEGSVEFETFKGGHCLRGDKQSMWPKVLRRLIGKYPVFEKNNTMLAFSPGALDFLGIFPNLKRVIGAGGITDVCYLEGLLSVKKYFDQNDRSIEVVAPPNLRDTYDAPWHNREEYNELAHKLLIQGGIQGKEYVIKKPDNFFR
jgi:Amidases related to nicotinamidase